MHWLFLLLSLGAMAAALRTTSMPLMVVSLLTALGLLVAWAITWFSSHAANSESGGRGIIDPVELHRLRQQADARKMAAQQTPAVTMTELRDGH